ncbi:hypothetical protein H6P81_012526 [Aristolochia fimbriata]|uniref:Uncharacterized protein n=1 Tax=Aristolochia fimbriata TaxID=158543 RepID=A0AAV7ECD3_ARIFI|nr:hypothetical protein H6P81_012526 [Aristolochia fimbriata]
MENKTHVPDLAIAGFRHEEEAKTENPFPKGKKLKSSVVKRGRKQCGVSGESSPFLCCRIFQAFVIYCLAVWVVLQPKAKAKRGKRGV